MVDAVASELERLRAAGHTQQSAAQALGIHREKLRRLCRQHGVRFDNRPRSHRYTRRTMFRGRQRTIAEIARIAGLRSELVYHRYWRGWRGEELALSPAKRGAPRRKVAR